MIANCSPVSSLRHSASVWVTGYCLVSMSRTLVLADVVAVEQLDRDAFGCAQEGNAHARPHRCRLAREHGALRLELGDHGVDSAHAETEMIEALVGRGRRGVDAVARRDRRNEDVAAAEL